MLAGTLAIVGVGMIGGSIALAARSRRVARRIVGYGPHTDALAQALQHGMLDSWQPSCDATLAEAEAIVICTPVEQIAARAVEAFAHAGPGALVTDVGSIKTAVLEDLRKQLPRGASFIGGHPLAGSDKSGPRFADVRLFENRLVVLTPDPWFAPEATDRASALWEALGARVTLMEASEHDITVGLTSHLPHLVAAALASALPDGLRPFAASGFRDTTRVAGGDADLWTGIFLNNRAALLQALAPFVAQVASFEQALRAGDRSALHDLLTQGKRNRDALGS